MKTRHYISAPFIAIKQEATMLLTEIDSRYTTWRKVRALNTAKRMADRRSKEENGRRYYVLPDHRGDYKILNMGEIKYLQKVGIMNKAVSIYDLLKNAVYFTKA